MPSIEQFKRVIQPIIWVVDTSASMAGERIRTVRQIISEHLKELEPYNATLDIQIGLLTFNDRATWGSGPMFESPEDIMIEEELSTPGGMTNIGDAFQELNKQLSSGIFGEKSPLTRLPYIVFVLDGFATDDYGPSLEALQQNRWFKRADKIGLALGDEADAELLKAVVGEEAVFSDTEMFKKMLHSIAFQLRPSEELVREDPPELLIDGQKKPGDFWDYMIEFQNHHVFLPKQLDICRCELCPCSPEDAKDVVLTLSVEDDTINTKIIDSSVCTSVVFHIPAQSKRVVPKAEGLVFEGLESKGAFRFQVIDHARDSVIVDNQMANPMTARIQTTYGMVVKLQAEDCILDQDGKKALTVLQWQRAPGIIPEPPDEGFDDFGW